MATTKNSPYKKVDVIQVYVWGKFVGALALDPEFNYYAFAYDPKFKRSGIELSPLKMPLADSADVTLFMDLPEATYKRLPALIGFCCDKEVMARESGQCQSFRQPGNRTCLRRTQLAHRGSQVAPF
jgi:hypothetical protein